MVTPPKRYNLNDAGNRKLTELFVADRKIDQIPYSDDKPMAPIATLGLYDSPSGGALELDLATFKIQKNLPGVFLTDSGETRDAYLLCDMEEGDYAALIYIEAPASGGYWLAIKCAAPVAAPPIACACDIIDVLFLNALITVPQRDALHIACDCIPVVPPDASIACINAGLGTDVGGAQVKETFNVTIAGISDSGDHVNRPWGSELAALTNDTYIVENIAPPFGGLAACQRYFSVFKALSRVFLAGEYNGSVDVDTVEIQLLVNFGADPFGGGGFQVITHVIVEAGYIDENGFFRQNDSADNVFGQAGAFEHVSVNPIDVSGNVAQTYIVSVFDTNSLDFSTGTATLISPGP